MLNKTAKTQHSTSHQQVNLNFEVRPTATGPLIVQKGVTVQPSALDQLFATLKQGQANRPVSARIGRMNESFGSSQSWDGPAHFRCAALRVKQNKGDGQVLFDHRISQRHLRRGNSAERNYALNRHNFSQPRSRESRRGDRGDDRSVYLAIDDVDRSEKYAGPRLRRVDAQSQTDEIEDVSGGPQEDFNMRLSSLSPSGRELPSNTVDKYTMSTRLKINEAGKEPMQHQSLRQLGRTEEVGPSNEERKFLNQADGRTEASRGPGANQMLGDAKQANRSEQSTLRSADEKVMMGGSKNQNGEGAASLQTDFSNPNLNDLVNFKNMLNRENKLAWTDEEQFHFGISHVAGPITFAPVKSTMGLEMHIEEPLNQRLLLQSRAGAASSAHLGTPPLGTTPVFESLKTKSVLSNKITTYDDLRTSLNHNHDSTQVELTGLSPITSTQRVSNALESERNMIFNPKQGGTTLNCVKGFEDSENRPKESGQAASGRMEMKLGGAKEQKSLAILDPINRREQANDHFYNVDGQIGLFSTPAMNSKVTTADNLKQQIRQAFREGVEGQDHRKEDPGDGQLLQNTSNVVWQVTQEPESTNVDIQLVAEQSSQLARKKSSAAEIKFPSRKSSNVDQSSSAKGSTKNTSKEVTKKKRRQGQVASASISLTPRIPLPEQSKSRGSPTGTSKGTTNKGSILMRDRNKNVSGSLRGTSSKMVLKSNQAMWAELPKSLPPPKPVAKATAKKKDDVSCQKPVEAIAQPTIQEAQTPVLREKDSENLLQTPKTVLSPAVLDQSTPQKKEGDQQQPQLLLVSCKKPVNPKKSRTPIAAGSATAEDLKIDMSKSEDVLQTQQCFPSTDVGNGIYFEGEAMKATNSFLSHEVLSEQMQTSKPFPQQAQARRTKNCIGQTSRNSNWSIGLTSSQRTSQSPSKQDRELKVLEVPPEYDTESDQVVEYMLGDKAIEILTPLFQFNIQSKLVFALTQMNGDEPPPFVKLAENRQGRKVIRIRSKETTGVQQLLQLKLEVRNAETNVMGVYKCRVFVRPGVKLLLIKPLFESPVLYSIKGPAKILQMPVYSAKHDDLDFYLESSDRDVETPSFIRISRDSHGNRVIKCQGNHMDEIGTYNLKLIARDKITRVINEEFTFTVVGTPGIEVKHLPKEYEQEIKVDPRQTLIQLAMPTFNLETVKEEEALPLEYSLVMRDGQVVPDCVVIKVLPNGDHVIELKAEDLPPGVPGENSVFEVQLKVYDPNNDATQLIPISVKCPEPNLLLVLKKGNFPEDVKYAIGSKAITFAVPQYERNDHKQIFEPLLLTLGGKESASIKKIVSIVTGPKGEQLVRIQTADKVLQGQYEVKVYATEQSQGLTNQEASFKLSVVESVLTLTETPNVCFLGKPIVYQPQGPSNYVPLPHYGIQRAQIQFQVVSKDPKMPLPPFLKLQDDYLVVGGSQNPNQKEYNLELQVFDPVSESRDSLPFQITTNIYEIVLEKLPFARTVIFNLGDELFLPLPVYRQVPFAGELTYELAIQGAGMMLGGLELASIVASKETGQQVIRIAGGENNDKGTYQITVVASEKTLGVANQEAVFMLEAKPQLKLVTRPKEFDQLQPLQVDKVYKLPVPTFSSKNRLRYQIQEKGTEDEQSCPNFISVRCPKQAQPYIEVKCSPYDLPKKGRFELEFISCDNQQHNVENVQDFAIEFDLQPRVEMTHFDVECPVRYTVKQGDLAIPMPIYDCYIVAIQHLQIKLVSNFNGQIVAFAHVDKDKDQIVIRTDSEGFEGLHDITVVIEQAESDKPHSSSTLKAIKNQQANFRVEISPPRPSVQSSKDEAKSLLQAIVPAAVDRSSETLALADNRSDECFQTNGIEQPNEIGDGDRISHIEEDIPIYYSDQSSDKLPLTPKQAPNLQHVVEVRTTPHQQASAQKGGTHSEEDVYGLRGKRRVDKQPVSRNSSAASDAVVIGQSDNRDGGRQRELRLEHHAKGRRGFEDIEVDTVSKMPQQQTIEQLKRENEEMRRRIAGVEELVDRSFAVLSHQGFRGTQETPQRADLQSLSQQASQQHHASMQILNSLQAQLQKTAALSLGSSTMLAEENFLQEEFIMNNQLKQKIEQSKLRHIQQMAEFERLRNEVTQGQTQHQQQLLNRYINETSGQGREKDIRLRQLRTQLAQLQEQRASLRKQCTELKQREDDLKSDIFTRNQQSKTCSKRSAEESTKVSTVISEIDQVVCTNEALKAEVQVLEDVLNEKKQIVALSRDRLRESNVTHSELETKLTYQKQRVTKLQLELDQQQQQQRHAAPAIYAATASYELQEPQQAATFSPPSANLSKAVHYKSAKQTQSFAQDQTHVYPQLELEMPAQIHAIGYRDQGQVSGRNDHVDSYRFSLPYNQGAGLIGAASLPQFNPTSFTVPPTGYVNSYTPSEIVDMPPAGMPSQRNNKTNTSITQHHVPQQMHLGSGMHLSMSPFANQSPMAAAAGQHYLKSAEKKIVNPPPQKPYRPADYNIFDSPSQNQECESRFQTTYTQFANREKFRGLKEGERGGLRVHNVPADGVCMLEQLRRQKSNLYPGVPSGLPSGISTEQRRMKDVGILPATAEKNQNYEKKYRH